MTVLPPLRCTFLQAFKIYSHTLVDLLPLLLLLAASQFFIDFTLQPYAASKWILWTNTLTQMAVSALFFSWMMLIIYNKEQQRTISYRHIFIEGMKRFIPLFTIYFMLCLPVLMAVLYVQTFNLFELKYLTDQEFLVRKAMILVILGAGAIASLCLFTTAFVAGIYIVIERNSPLAALKRSWHALKPVWLDTLLILIVMGMILIAFSIIFEEFKLMASGLILTIMLSSFYPSLMMVRFKQIQSENELT